jgi:hypothetical protein
MSEPLACFWCARSFEPRRGGSPQRCGGARCRTMFWSAVRRWAECAVADGVLTVADIRNADPAACTLLEHREPGLPLTNIESDGTALSDVPLSFLVQVDPKVATNTESRLLPRRTTAQSTCICLPGPVSKRTIGAATSFGLSESPNTFSIV